VIQSIIDAHHTSGVSVRHHGAGPAGAENLRCLRLGTFDRACSAERWRPYDRGDHRLVRPSVAFSASNFPIRETLTSYARLVGNGARMSLAILAERTARRAADTQRVFTGFDFSESSVDHQANASSPCLEKQAIRWNDRPWDHGLCHVQEPNRGGFPWLGHDIAEPALARFAEMGRPRRGLCGRGRTRRMS